MAKSYIRQKKFSREVRIGPGFLMEIFLNLVVNYVNKDVLEFLAAEVRPVGLNGLRIIFVCPKKT